MQNVTSKAAPAELLARFEGVTAPEEMGTTGLAAWALCGCRRFTFNRWQKSVGIIRQRNGEKAAAAFARVLVDDAARHCGDWLRDRFAGYSAKLNP